MPLFTGNHIIELSKTDSTNSDLMAMLSDGNLPEGTVVWTKKQRSGRGQRGNDWQSEPGKNLTFSLVWHPHFLRIDQQFYLSMAVALGVHHYLTEEQLEEVAIKWPNDVLVKDRKIAGILIETVVNKQQLKNAVVGIGLNVNQLKFDPNLKAVAMRHFRLRDWVLEDVLKGLCASLEPFYLMLRSGQLQQLEERYLSLLWGYKEFKTYHYDGKTIAAKITGVQSSGHLLLEDEKGNEIKADFQQIKPVL